MPKPPVPASYDDLLHGTVLGHLATVTAAGAPQVNPIWFIWRDGKLHFSVRGETRKLENMQANPKIALSILDPGNGGRYLELRGEVESIELSPNLDWVNELSRKYTGGDYAYGQPGQERYKVVVKIDQWTGMG